MRQLRLRDIGGIIVVDFIDMVLETNRDLVLRRLVECLSRDRTKHQVAEVTSLGLVQMDAQEARASASSSRSARIARPARVAASSSTTTRCSSIVPRSARTPAGRTRPARPAAVAVAGAAGRCPASGVKNGVGGVGTHAITEDVKNALAQIAKSTVTVSGDHHHTETPAGEAHSAGDVAVASAETAVEILDIPVQKASRASRKVSTADAENILGSVLEALPEPKPAGQGRRGSRRASTGGTVTPAAAVEYATAASRRAAEADRSAAGRDGRGVAAADGSRHPQPGSALGCSGSGCPC